MACYGRSSSREWSGQILCGEAWQNEEGGEAFNVLTVTELQDLAFPSLEYSIIGSHETTYLLIQ